MGQSEVRYGDRKEAIKAVLRYCAMQGQTVRYGVLGKAVGIPAQGPWRPVLNEISREEKPDLTFLVVNADGLSSQIDFEPAKPPGEQQRKAAERTIQEVYAHYAR